MMEEKNLYEYIRGVITFVSPYYIVVETAGMGYQLAVANPFSFASRENQEITVYLYQAVREDAITLYGFNTLEEKNLFIKLISVSGIGPKSGLAIMAGDDHDGLVNAIETEDSKYLTKFPGVGKKTAQQMILDLKGKLGELVISELTPGTTQLSLDTKVAGVDKKVLSEALEALEALGYSARELKRITSDLEKYEATTTDAYLRQGLKLLLKK